MIKVVAGNTAWKPRIVAFDQLGIVIAQLLQPAVHCSNPAAFSDLSLQLFFIHPADTHARAVVEQNVHGFDIVHRLTGHLGVSAAGIVSQHPPERTVRVRGRIWAPRQPMGLGSVSEVIANRSRLNARVFLTRIQLNDVVQILAPVDDNGNIAALTGDARTAATRENWCAEPAARSYCPNNIFKRFRNDDRDGYLPVIGCVHRIHAPAAGIKSDFTVNTPAQFRFQPADVNLFLEMLGRLITWFLQIVGSNQRNSAGGHSDFPFLQRTFVRQEVSGRF